MTTGAMLFVLPVTNLLMRAASVVLRALHAAGTAILTRVMGMILTALAVEFVLDALRIGR